MAKVPVTLTPQNSPPAPRRLGRRSVQTPERAKIICDALARGLPYVHACAIAKICFQTFSVWRNRDATFRQQIDEAIAHGVERRLKKIEAAAEAGDWRAAAFLVTHCPGQAEHFSDRNRIELTGADGRPLSAGNVLIYLPQKEKLAMDGNGEVKPAIVEKSLEHEGT